ncbi:hypothetical protein BN133_84 [Cronobacter dublinensis 582]|nr:hypothetical protein BN133_84 [Cronobacter dublinensis 582]
MPVSPATNCASSPRNSRISSAVTSLREESGFSLFFSPAIIHLINALVSRCAPA